MSLFRYVRRFTSIKPGARPSVSKMCSIYNFVNRCRAGPVKRYRPLILILHSIMPFRPAFRWRVPVWYDDKWIAPYPVWFSFFLLSIIVHRKMNEPYWIDTACIHFSIPEIKPNTYLFYTLRGVSKKEKKVCSLGNRLSLLNRTGF